MVLGAQRYKLKYFRYAFGALLFCCIFSSKATADFDVNVGANLRAYPLSGTVESEMGYGYLVWGDGGDKKVPWFGYVRPALKLNTAVFYNSGELEVGVFPISFLGVTVGGAMIHNAQDYVAYECDKYQCEGRFWNTQVTSHAAVGLGPWFLLAKWRVSDWHQQPGRGKNFVEPGTALALQSGGDTMKTVTVVTGLDLNDKWMAGAYYTWSKSQSLAQQSYMALAIAGYKQDVWQFQFGVGIFHSDLKDKEVTALMRAVWQGLPSLSLF